jgi:malate dehydrogenase (oxaloacetate-decarboxylating)(NADP+)
VALRSHPLYLGLPVPRVKGPEYFELVDEWMHAMRSRWPNALIQFEGMLCALLRYLLSYLLLRI